MNERFYAGLQEQFISASGLKVGDPVKLVATGYRGMLGWDGNWESYNYSLTSNFMEDGENEFVIQNIDPTKGFEICNSYDNDCYWVPFPCIQSLANPTRLQHVLEDSGMDIIIHLDQDMIELEDGTEISFDDLDKLLEKINKMR